MLDWATWLLLIIYGLGVPLGTAIWFATLIVFLLLTARIAGKLHL